VGNYLSIPSHCWVPAIEQTVSSALIAPFISTIPIYNSNLLHFALVVTPTATRDNTKVSIGGATPQALVGTWNNNLVAGMSFYSYELTNTTASYVFTNPDGIIIFGYGVGNAFPVSYYYLVKINVAKIYFFKIFMLICQKKYDEGNTAFSYYRSFINPRYFLTKCSEYERN